MYHSRPQWSERSAMTHKSIILTPAPRYLTVGNEQKQLVIQAPSADLNQSITDYRRSGLNSWCQPDWTMPINHPPRVWRKRHRLWRPMNVITVHQLISQGIDLRLCSEATHCQWQIVLDHEGHTHRVVYIIEEHISQIMHYGFWDTSQSISEFCKREARITL